MPPPIVLHVLLTQSSPYKTNPFFPRRIAKKKHGLILGTILGYIFYLGIKKVHFQCHNAIAKKLPKQLCLYLLNGTIESGVEVCRTHVVLECELPATVLSQIKPAQSKKIKRIT